MLPEQAGGVARLVDSPTRFLLFTGKGGVGKTSLACASAVALADRGRRVLLISTDPASNLDEVLGVTLGATPTLVPGVPRLAALNVDPLAAAQRYRDRLITPLRGRLPEAVLRSMEEQLAGACTTEIAAFDEFTGWLGTPESTSAFDHVIFDTAPTGHTLRLLALPGAWTGFLASSSSGYSCLGPLAGLEKQRVCYEAALAALCDEGRTSLVLVSRPQAAALAEAERASNELAAIGVKNQRLVLNGVFHARARDPVAMALESRSKAAVASKAAFLARLPVVEVPLRSNNLVGVAALRSLADAEGIEVSSHRANDSAALARFESLEDLVADLERAGRGVIMTMGKGGVGKTTIAAAIAVRLAGRGHRVELSTTDPAAHVATAAGMTSGLSVSRIDPQVETRAYVEQVMASAGEGLDQAARALLEEDLRSPCTEEIAVFRAFARIVTGGADGFVVLDTAPTGHTLLLLDATEAYHREIGRKANEVPKEVRELLPRLRNPDWTRVLIVTLPEPTPVHEAATLQDDLRRANIEPFAWVVNQSFATCGSHDPILSARAQGEAAFLGEICARHARRTIRVEWRTEDPVGADRLQQLFQTENSRSGAIP